VCRWRCVLRTHRRALADTDADAVSRGVRGEGDVADERSPHGISVPGGARPIGSAGLLEGLWASGVGQCQLPGGVGLESGLGFRDDGQFGLPSLFEAAGDEPVLRFTQLEGTLRAGGLVAGALDS